MTTMTSVESGHPTKALHHIARGLRRSGVGGSVRLGAALLARLAFLRESHIWYLLDLRSPRPRLALPAGMELIRGREDDLDLLVQLATIGRESARRRLAAGTDLWLVRDGHRAAFACWIFRDRTPAIAARGGWLELPRGLLGLEDSVASPAYRGRAVAPAAWSAIGDTLAHAHETAILTKIEEANLPCRSAIEKAGFRAAAVMRLRRIAGRSRVSVELNGPSEAAFLAACLVR